MTTTNELLLNIPPELRSPTERNFSDSFKGPVKLRTDRKHSWKSHAWQGTLMYEVLGYLDFCASKDSQRFIYAKLPYILNKCNKGLRKEGKHYSIQHLKRVFAELAARHIVSPYFTTWDHRYGFIFEPHDLRCRQEGNFCVMRTPKHYECSAEEEILFREMVPFGRPAGDRLETMKETVLETMKETADSLQPDDKSAFTKTESTSGNAIGIYPLNRSVRVAVGTEQTTVVTGDHGKDQEEQRQEQPQSQNRESVSSSSGLTDQRQNPAPMKTIGDHFALGVTVELITDGEFDTEAAGWSKDEWKTFLGCMQEAVDAKDTRPFSGRATCAQLMGDAMKSLRESHGKQAPKGWVPTMKSLRATPGPALMKCAEEQKIADAQKAATEMWSAFGVVPDGNGGWKKPDAN